MYYLSSEAFFPRPSGLSCALLHVVSLLYRCDEPGLCEWESGSAHCIAVTENSLCTSASPVLKSPAIKYGRCHHCSCTLSVGLTLSCSQNGLTAQGTKQISALYQARCSHWRLVIVQLWRVPFKSQWLTSRLNSAKGKYLVCLQGCPPGSCFYLLLANENTTGQAPHDSRGHKDAAM